jgi:hypothetical protein
MSLDKAIQYGKEKRVQYRRSLVFDRSCRNHGNCGYCESNRTIQSQRENGRLHGQEDEYYGWHNLPDGDDFSCPACDQLDYFCSDCSNEMVAGNLTNGELVTVEAWNKLVDQQDERLSDWNEYCLLRQ